LKYTKVHFFSTLCFGKDKADNQVHFMTWVPELELLTNSSSETLLRQINSQRLNILKYLIVVTHSVLQNC